MPKLATSSDTAASPKVKPIVKKQAVKRTAPEPSIKENAAAVKDEVKKMKAAEKEKVRKPKLVRDSFTMPEDEYKVLREVKSACLKAGIEAKKSELLRVGVSLLRQLDTSRIKKALDDLPSLKAGRPKKSK